MNHPPYKHCKRCARKLFGLTNKYSCYAYGLDFDFTLNSGGGSGIGKWISIPSDKDPQKVCKNFSKDVIKPLGF